MSLRQIPSDRVGNFINTNQQRIVITQVQTNQTQSGHLQQQRLSTSNPSGISRASHISIIQNSLTPTVNNNTLRVSHSGSASSSAPILMVSSINSSVGAVQNQVHASSCQVHAQATTTAIDSDRNQ